jgi:uncharacterized small protein (DUF1192 family)
MPMLEPDDSPPRKPERFPPRALDPLGIAELRDYIAQLQAEIARADAEIARKERHRDAVEGLFRK